MSWLILFLASIFEVGWPVGLKMAEIGNNKPLWIIFAIIAMTLSGILLFYAQKNIPIGTAYAVWTGVGASCTFLIGILVFNDTMSLMRAFGIILIISGVVLLKIGH